MRIRSFISRLALASAVATCLITVTCFAFAQAGRQGQPNVSADEQNAAKGIMSAPDAAAKLKAATDFIKKYPKSALRPRVAQGVAAQIAGVTDAAQQVTLAQGYQGVFKEQSEQELIVPVLIAAYAAAKRVDEAFSTGSDFLAHDPDSVSVLVDLTLVGTEQAKQHNAKFVPQSLQFGAHAIELMEANRKPAAMNDAGWKDYKSSMLPAMYQSMGLLNLVKGDRDESKARFTKAAELSPTDAFNYLMLTGILNDEYQAEAKRYQAMTAGPAKQAELQKAQGMLDGVIDAYAHAIALSEGNAVFQAIRQQYLQDLEAYYKYRHNNSTAGMQQLIDKYKILNLKP